MTRTATQRYSVLDIAASEVDSILGEYREHRVPKHGREGRKMARQRRNGNLHLAYRFWRQSLREKAVLKSTHRVEADYQESYQGFDFDEYGYPPMGKPVRYRVGENYEEVYSSGPKLVSTLAIERVLRHLKPGSVCECGTGTGRNVVFLAARNPEMTFRGFDLSTAAIETAHAALARDSLDLRALDYVPLLDRAALSELATRIQFTSGSAAAIDMPDKSVDVMFTSAALEQMWEIRDAVLSEIRRVTRSHVVFYEPFWDANDLYGRLFLRAGNYFRYRVSDLTRHGFDVEHYNDSFPVKPTFAYSMAVAKVT